MEFNQFFKSDNYDCGSFADISDSGDILTESDETEGHKKSQHPDDDNPADTQGK
jgi:hypothetical protein